MMARLTDRFAPHPSLRATFSPLCGEKENPSTLWGLLCRDGSPKLFPLSPF